MKSLKEKELLAKFATALGGEVDLSIVQEVKQYKELKDQVKENIKGTFLNDFLSESKNSNKINKLENSNEIIEFPKPPSIDDLNLIIETPTEEEKEFIQEIVEEVKEETLAQKAADFITKEIKIEEESFQQPDPDPPSRNIEDIRRKVKYLEQWLGKISAHGPGGGAGDVINLDFPVKLVTADYTVTRKDYYIGVNSSSPVEITLLDTIGFPGRKVVIKDESGNCSSNPISVVGNVDNDPGGFILQVDNGGIQMIYREGWRII